MGGSGQGHLGSGFSQTISLFQSGVSWCVQKSGSYSYMGWVTHKHPHIHTHTHTHTHTYSRYYHLRLVMVLLVGYELKKCISVKIQTCRVSTGHYVCQMGTMCIDWAYVYQLGTMCINWALCVLTPHYALYLQRKVWQRM